LLSFLRRWFKKKSRLRLPFLPLSPELVGRSRFIAGNFRDDEAFRPELGYRLYLPSGSSRRDSLPLVVMLHGCKQDALSFSEGTRMNTLADESRCAVLYPEQSKRHNALRCWNWFESASLDGHGEAALIARLIEQITERRPVDPERVCAVGMSAGGAMASILTVRHSRLFAACAIHSGLMYGAARSPLQGLAAMQSGPTTAAIDKARKLAISGSGVIVPTLVIHGESDTTVNPVNADQIVALLKARAESLGPAAGELLSSDERRSESGGLAYRQQDYLQRGRLVVRRLLVEGLGHAWSGGDPRYEFNDAAGPDASRLILDFALQYQRLSTLAARVAGAVLCCLFIGAAGGADPAGANPAQQSAVAAAHMSANIPRSQYHFTKYPYGLEARSHFDPLKPTSLLYRKTANGGYTLIGAELGLQPHAIFGGGHWTSEVLVDRFQHGVVHLQSGRREVAQQNTVHPGGSCNLADRVRRRV
jgi:poly(hydroxyalkanoate) depolymerase family esterase